MQNNPINIKQYNDLYTYELNSNYFLRYYNSNVPEDLIFYSELQVSLLKAVEKYNLKVFYFKGEPKSNLQITFRDFKFITLSNKIITLNTECWNLNDKTVELKNNDVFKIKDLLCKDINFLYKNQLFEILYKFPKLNNKNNYYFDFILAVNNNFDINLIYNYNFNLINIISVNELNINDITYQYFKNLFQNRIIFNNYTPICENESYSFKNSELSIENFIKIYNNNNPEYESQKYRNIKSYLHNNFFNQDEYVNYLGKFLDIQILSMDRELVKIKNSYGFMFENLEKYDLNSVFLVDSYIIGEKYCSGCTFDMSDNYSIFIQPLNKSFINQQPNLENVLILTEEELRFHGYNKYE